MWFEITLTRRESFPGWPQRHAQVQQPGSLHADRHDRSRKYRQRRQVKDNIWAINTEMEYHEEKAAK